MPNGGFRYRFEGGSFFNGKPFSAFENITGASGALLSQTLLDASGEPISTTTYNADGTVNLAYTITKLANGDVDYHYAGGSFFRGKAFASFDNVTTAAGLLLSQELYDGSGTPTQQTFFNADGSIYEQATDIKLANGNLDHHYAVGSYFAGKPFAAFDNITSGTTGRWLSQTYYDANGKITAQTTYNADGSLQLGYTVSKLPDGTTDTHFAGGSFFTGKSFAAFDNVTSASGALQTQTLYDSAGNTTQQTQFNANGTIRLQDAVVHPAAGQILYQYRAGSFFTDKSYLAFDNLATTSGTLLDQLLYNCNGTHSYTVPGSGLTLYAVKNDIFNVTGQSESTRFNAAGFGKDVFNGYKAGDVFSFSPSIFANYAALSAHVSGTTSAVITDTAGDTLTLAGVAKSSVTAAMFRFA